MNKFLVFILLHEVLQLPPSSLKSHGQSNSSLISKQKQGNGLRNTGLCCLPIKKQVLVHIPYFKTHNICKSNVGRAPRKSDNCPDPQLGDSQIAYMIMKPEHVSGSLVAVAMHT